MALQGTLDTFSLPDVLRLLATTSKTGRLRLDGDRGQGSVWLADGGVVDADADRVVEGTPIDEVVFELLRFDAGAFAFHGDETSTDGGEPEDVDTLLRRAHSLLSEWSELEAVVPSLEHEVSLSSDLSVDEVTIDADHWRSLVAVASGRTVGELATSLGLTELGVSRAVRDLVDLGVADVGAPGTGPARSPQPAGIGDARRLTAPGAEPNGVAAVGTAPLTGENPRAGWLRTGEIPAVEPERRSAPAGNGQARASLDDTIATPAPPPVAPPDPPAKGGLAARLGRNRNASPASRPPGRATTGSTPAVSNGSARADDRPPVTPPARPNDTGRSRPTPTDNNVPTGRRPDLGAPRRSPAEGTTRPPSPGGPASPAGPSGPVGPSRPGVGGPGVGDSPFDGGRLGPAPSARDTGQIRPVAPSSLPPDLHWAADDTTGGTVNGNATSPFSGLSSLGGPGAPGSHGGPTMPPSRPARSDGEIAPHVAAMSPEARSAVQSTVGNDGGSSGRGASQGEDIAQRGRLISFLSTVR